MTRLGVVFGSRSVEHEVSIITATQLMKHVDRSLYSVVPLYIDKRGRWWTGEVLADVATFQHLDLQNPQVDGIESIEFSPDPTKDHGIDVAIFCTHGGHGEDGTLAGLFELANIPYAAPGVVAAAVAIDKVITKLVFEHAGIPVTKYRWFTAHDWDTQRDSTVAMLEKNLTFPMFVKPATLGSSVGVTKVRNRVELETALDVAAQFDTRFVVEENADDCIEVNVSVQGNADEPHVSLTEQPVKTDEFLTYADKYERGGKKSKGMASLSRRIPAPVSPDLDNKIKDAARKIWKTVGGSGVVRIDFFANPSTEEIFVGELNCPPGSMAFYLWEAAGVGYPELIDRLVATAVERQERKNALTHSIDSNILQKQDR